MHLRVWTLDTQRIETCFGCYACGVGVMNLLAMLTSSPAQNRVWDIS